MQCNSSRFDNESDRMKETEWGVKLLLINTLLKWESAEHGWHCVSDDIGTEDFSTRVTSNPWKILRKKLLR